jgi:iron(III) transport system permease protein
MLLGCGLAGTGKFRGDAFVAGAVVLCAALLLLFVALPVAVALAGAFVDDAGRFSLAAVAERLGHERTWGLGCLAGGVRCGVAWNTLFLALLTAVGTTVLGTLLALVAERGAPRLKTPVHLLSVLPIITPAVRRRPRPDPAVRPRRHRQPGARVGLRRDADALVLRPAGPLAGAAVRVHADRLPDHARRRRRHQPLARGGGADAARRPLDDLSHGHLPLLTPGLANAFLVGFIESVADFGNPIVVGGQYSVFSTEVFFAIVGAQFDQGRAASLALVLSVFALVAFLLQQKAVGRVGYTTVSGKGDAGVPMRLPAGLSRGMLAIVLPWLAFTIVVYLFAFAGGFVATWGRDYTPTCATSSPPSTCSGPTRPPAVAWSGPAPPGTRCSRP